MTTKQYIRLVILATALIVIMWLMCGCVHTVAKSDKFEFNRWAVLYPFKTGGLEYDTSTGLITILDYNTDGGTATAGAIAEGVARGLK